MKQEHKTYLYIVGVLSAIIVGVVLYYQLSLPQESTISQLASVEINEYQGENLSSIENFRENSIKGPQYIDINNYTLMLIGLVGEEKNYTYDEIINNHKKYEKVVTLNCVEGWSVIILWEGILLRDLFDEVKINSDANTVIFYAVDGYSTSLPLDYILSNNIMIAYKMNGVTLSPERGYPFQLVAEDKLGYKWIKWITKIELSNDPSYKGYWESRGYPNDADVK